MGHGYFLEDGGEKYNIFDGNLAMNTRRGTGKFEPVDKTYDSSIARIPTIYIHMSISHIYCQSPTRSSPLTIRIYNFKGFKGSNSVWSLMRCL